MEPHKNFPPGIKKYAPDLKDGSHEYFRKARIFAEKFYGDEIDSILSVKFDEVSPDLFFRECIWVIHATGFSAAAVGKFFPRLSAAYSTFEVCSERDFNKTFEEVKQICNNKPKATAVCKIAKIITDGIEEKGWEKFRNEKFNEPNKLKNLPFIGPVTCFHLGRNIGLLDCVKPDLHLVRMAQFWGYEDCDEMCKDVQPEGIPLGIVDLILWYGSSTFGTLSIRQPGER